MSIEANKALIRRFVTELHNGRNYAIIDELVAPDLIEHEELPTGVPDGRAAVKVAFQMFHTAMPDLRVSIDDLIAEGDRAVVRLTWTGTQRGDLFGVPASGAAVAFASIDILRVVDGQLVEHWAVTDNLRLMQQIGAVPVPEGL